MTRPFSESPTSELEEILVHDVPEPCPYLPGVTARMPLRLQFERDPERLDRLLAKGDRRVGPLMYRPQCPTCNACESLRIPLELFENTRSHRRTMNRNKDLHLVISTPPATDHDRVNLFNEHRLARGLSKRRLGAQGYQAWLSQTWTESLEFAWYLDGKLVMVSIVDIGQKASSAVYCYFDPAHSKRSLGTFAILKSIEWGKKKGFTYHYLGLHVAANAHLAYKSRFLPHERLIEGTWQTFNP